MHRFAITVLCLIALAGCSSPDLRDSAMAEPAFDLPGYFTGHTRAWGQFQDRFGKVRRRFTVDIDGTWNGDVLTLNESFLYDDGATETRIWTLRRSDDNTWVGYADGVLGEATGQIAGNAFNWRYVFDLPIGDGKTLHVAFDDWLWRQDERVVINRAYLSKFGVALGEVLIFFTKEDVPEVAVAL